MKRNINVVVRIKPNFDLKSNSNHIKIINDKIINIKQKNNNKENKYEFDKIITKDKTQKEVFDIIGKPIIEEVINGYNCTICSYGQTGSGKTYTMEGDNKNIGIIPRIIKEINNIFSITNININSTCDKNNTHL